MVGTFKAYHMPKNLFELIALGKTLGTSTCAWAQGLMLTLAPMSHLVKLSLPNICCVQLF